MRAKTEWRVLALVLLAAGLCDLLSAIRMWQIRDAAWICFSGLSLGCFAMGGWMFWRAARA